MKKTLLTTLLALSATSTAALDCEDGFRAFTHAAGEDCIPVDPQRVVTLQDQNALLPIMEVGVVPVGSAGHMTDDGPVFRRMQGFDTSSVAFVGSYREPDAEAVAALNPDLIIATPWPQGAYEIYSKIAPTVVIDLFSMDMGDALIIYADAVGQKDRALELQAEFEAEAAALRTEHADALANTTVSVVEYWDNRITMIPAKQSLGLVFPGLDLNRTEFEQGIDDWTDVSAEILGANPADMMILVATADDQVGSIDPVVAEFMANPAVQVTDVAKANQIFPIDGNVAYGASWGAATESMRAFAKVIGQAGINRDLVAESPR